MELATTSPVPNQDQAPWTAVEFEAQLRERGKAYHINHQFNVRLNSGECSPEERFAAGSPIGFTTRAVYPEKMLQFWQTCRTVSTDESG